MSNGYVWAVSLIALYGVVCCFCVFYIVYTVFIRQDDSFWNWNFWNVYDQERLRKRRRRRMELEKSDARVPSLMVVLSTDQKLTVFILMLFNMLFRISVFIGGLYQESNSSVNHTDAVTRIEQQELLENLPGFLNISICTLVVINCIHFIYGSIYRRSMITVMICNLLLGGLLLVNDYISVYFPDQKVTDHVMFYVISFFTFLGFSIASLSYLLIIVCKRVRKQTKTFDKWGSRRTVVITILALLICYVFRGIILILELVKWKNQELSTFNYPDVSDAGGSIFFVYYFIGEIIPSALLLFLSLILHKLEILTSNKPRSKSQLNSSNRFGPLELLKKLKMEEYSVVQTHLDTLLTSPIELYKFQHEELIQQLVTAAERNKIVGYLQVTITDPKRETPILIDHGRYKVYEVTVEEYPNINFAAKFIPEDALNPTSTELCEFNRDASCVNLLIHENIVRSFGVAKVYFNNMDYRAIVMEKMETDLFKLIETNAKGGTLPRTKEALIYAIGIARGMRHLHLMGILHRDLKAKNILISADSTSKIADFGQARSASGEMTPWDVGTPPYTAPEICSKTGTYDQGSDVYSFGVILLELFFPGYFKIIHSHSQRFTFKITNEHEISLKLSSNSQKKKKCLETIAKLITECGKTKRPSFSSIVETLENIAREMYGTNEKMNKVLESTGAPKQFIYREDILENSFSEDDSRRASLGVTPETTLTKEDLLNMQLPIDERKPLLIKSQ